MASLTRLPQGQNVLNRFYQSSYTIYVEGDDDVIFWENLFPYIFQGIRVKFLPAGNCIMIDQYINDIVNNGSSLIVIRDQDYLWATNRIIHPRVIYTYGHSLENTLYSIENISKTISIVTKTRNRYRKMTKIWLENLATQISNLQVLEAANIALGRGVRVLGDSSSIVLTHYNSSNIDPTKVTAAVTSLAGNFSTREITMYSSKLAKVRRPKYMLVRGHFMSLAVLNFVNEKIKLFRGVHRIHTFNHNSLFSQLIGQANPSNLNQSDFKHLQRSLSLALSSP